MQKVAVTGANGLVGHYTVQALLAGDFFVQATSKKENRLPFTHDNFAFHPLDYTDKQAVEDFFAREKPEVIIHCGALSKPDECEQHKEAAYLNNVTGTIQLLQAAEKLEAHFIFLSTDFVFNGKTGLYTEEDNRDPVNYYGETKLIAEDEVIRYPFLWSIVRTVLVYGKSIPKRENFVTNVANNLKAGQMVRAFKDQSRTLTYAGDLADGIVQIVKRQAAGVYHLAGKDRLTLFEAATRIAKSLSYDPNLVLPVIEANLPLIAKRPNLTGLNISKAKKDLGYKPLSFAAGLKKTIDH